MKFLGKNNIKIRSSFREEKQRKGEKLETEVGREERERRKLKKKGTGDSDDCPAKCKPPRGLKIKKLKNNLNL